MWVSLLCLGSILRVVEFENKEDAQKAMKELHESVLDGRKIYLREVKPLEGGNLCEGVG